MMNTIIARLHGLTNNPELCRLGEAHVDVAILLLTALASQSAGWIPTFATTWLRWLPLRVRFYSKRIFGVRFYSRRRCVMLIPLLAQTPFADATSASIVAMFQLSQERVRVLERDGRIADAVQAKQLMNLAHDDALRKNDHLERDRTERDREIARLHRALQQAKVRPDVVAVFSVLISPTG